MHNAVGRPEPRRHRVDAGLRQSSRRRHRDSTDKSKYFAGQADDPFFADLRVFDLLYGGDLSETGNDTLEGYNVNALALQVPKARLAEGGNAGANPIVGIWSTPRGAPPGGNGSRSHGSASRW